MPRIPRRFKSAGPPAADEQATSVAEPAHADGATPGPQAPAEGAVAAPEAATAVATDEAATTSAPAVTAEGAPAEAATTVSPAVAPAEAPPQDGVVVEQAPADARPGFRDRTRMRRRLRYLRRLREVAFRDLGGLLFDLHRFGRDRGDLVGQKLDALSRIDGELRTLEEALRERRELTELREPGIAACPRCQTLHDTDANFCPGCGTPLRGAVVRDASPVTVSPADAPS